MSSEEIKVLEIATNKQLELCNKIIHAAEIVYDIYGEVVMTNVVEEVLESEHAKYTVEEVQNYYVKLVDHKIIDLAS
ncbi:hypothetical protein [Fusibacter ferrireducens]|uniref:Uncharacterized protein n=1 Tax=Fusibacter ferrireducens TaxID=2785058 RepID=A0ABR9ZVX1_9FIRM|nr:hypothetical protein [Fusibacter ferrireducens]MBF4694583.1 hypothetical protein [Fusibacter ferrireducens]